MAKPPPHLATPTRMLTDPAALSPFLGVGMTGDRVAAFSDQRVSIWALETGELLASHAFPAPVTGGAFAPPLDRVTVLGGPSKMSGEWSGVTTYTLGAGLVELGSDDFPRARQVSVTTDALAVSGRGYVWLCDADATKRVRSPAHEVGPTEPMYDRLMREHGAPVGKISDAALGRGVIAALEDGAVSSYSLPTFEKRWSQPMRGAVVLAMGPGNRVLAANAQKKAVLFGEDGATLWEANLIHPNTPGFAFSAGGETIVTGKFVVLHGATGKWRAALAAGHSGVVAASPDGNTVVTADYQTPGRVSVWALP